MADSHQAGRRSYDDSTYNEIKELILDTDNPKDKGILLLLLRISEDLARNTSITETTAAKVATHSLLVTKAKTAWWVLSGLLFVINGLALVIFQQYAAEYKELRNAVQVLRKDVDVIQERRRLEDEVAKMQQKGVK